MDSLNYNEKIKKLFETIYLKENRAFDRMFWFNEDYPFVILAKDYLSHDGNNKVYNLHEVYKYFKLGLEQGNSKCQTL